MSHHQVTSGMPRDAWTCFEGMLAAQMPPTSRGLIPASSSAALQASTARLAADREAMLLWYGVVPIPTIAT